jgi:hypothetical protein
VQYDRTVIAYHGCSQETADRLLAGGSFTVSENDYDWLGRGIYFWEFGPDRARRWAEARATKRGETAGVVGALVQLGNCFDLLDTRYAADLASAYESWASSRDDPRVALPTNDGNDPDRRLRRRDCALLNWYLDRLEKVGGVRYDTVRSVFVEGPPIYEGGGFLSRKSHSDRCQRTPRSWRTSGGVRRAKCSRRSSKLASIHLAAS